MTKITTALLTILLSTFAAWAQGAAKKYPWQVAGTNCTEGMTFCWYGSDEVTDPEVTAFGARWVSPDKGEKPFEWVSEVRCIQTLHICIVARNQKVLFGGGTITNIDLYHIKEWSEFQIRAVEESDLPHGKECEIDSLMLNREDASVTMLSAPGPGATTKFCQDMMKPKTVMYRLELMSSKPEKETP
jgi:hypothetical protein